MRGTWQQQTNKGGSGRESKRRAEGGSTNERETEKQRAQARPKCSLPKKSSQGPSQVLAVNKGDTCMSGSNFRGSVCQNHIRYLILWPSQKNRWPEVRRGSTKSLYEPVAVVMTTTLMGLMGRPAACFHITWAGRVLLQVCEACLQYTRDMSGAAPSSLLAGSLASPPSPAKGGTGRGGWGERRIARRRMRALSCSSATPAC